MIVGLGLARPVSLYVHIPYCKKKCAYCDFFSLPSGNEMVPDSYILALLEEASFYAKKYNANFWKTVYIGGGTPSLLSSEQLSALIMGLKKICPLAEGCEVTVEMNPDDITDDLLCSARDCGVNRISVGIQSLSDKVLEFCGRRCTRKTSLEALELLRKKWKASLSVDLISGLPYDDEAQMEQTLGQVIDFSPDHISLYSLTIEESTPLGKAFSSGKISYDFDKADNLWIFGRNFLERSGYAQYEVSNFAKSGFESVHNKTYWHLQDYIGIGAGATGSVYSNAAIPSDGNFSNGIRWTNLCDVKGYIDFWTAHSCKSVTEREIPRTVESLDFATQEFEFLMMGFRLLEGVSEEEYRFRFNRSLEKRLERNSLFYEWQRKGLARIIQKDRTYYSLTGQGIMLLNQFLESLLE